MLISKTLVTLKCCPESIHWAHRYTDFETAYNECEEACWIGFLAAKFDLTNAIETVKPFDQNNYLQFSTPIAVYNVLANKNFLLDYVKAKYPFEKLWNLFTNWLGENL